MRRVLVLPVLLALATLSFADDEQAVCPKHIEVPVYPAIARTAHVSSDVVVKVTLDADGRVAHAEVVSGSPLLQRASLDSVRSWSFSKPPHEGFTQLVTCSYKIDDKVPDGSRDVVTFDFPNRVTVTAPAVTIQPQESTHH